MQLTEELLWDYADDLLSDAEKDRVAAQLHLQPAQQLRLDAILGEKKAMFDMPLARPANDFSKQVMKAWAAEQQAATAMATSAIGQNSKDWVLRGLTMALAFFFVAPLVMVFAKGGVQPLNTGFLPKIEPPMWWQQLDLVSALHHPALLYSGLLMLVYLLLRMFDHYLQVQGFGLKEA
jgi:hypothetical protein